MANSYSSSSHDPYEYAWLAGIGLGAVFALWYFAGGTITGLFLQIKQTQLWLLLQVWPDNESLGVLYAAVNRSLQDPARVSFKALLLALDAVGRYWRWPAIGVLIGLGGWLLW